MYQDEILDDLTINMLKNEKTFQKMWNNYVFTPDQIRKAIIFNKRYFYVVWDRFKFPIELYIDLFRYCHDFSQVWWDRERISDCMTINDIRQLYESCQHCVHLWLVVEDFKTPTLTSCLNLLKELPKEDFEFVWYQLGNWISGYYSKQYIQESKFLREKLIECLNERFSNYKHLWQKTIVKYQLLGD